MDKRNLVKGVVVGTIASITAGIGGRSVFASEPDWRDELLDMHVGWTIYRKNLETTNLNVASKKMLGEPCSALIMLAKRHAGNYQVIHKETWKEYKNGSWYTHDYKLEGDGMNFGTLKEAYEYAKQLKEKHYG